MYGLLFKPGYAGVRDAAASFSVGEWTRLVLGSVLCLLSCQGIANAVGLPVQPGFSGSLLCGGSPLLSILMSVLAIAASLVVGAIVAGPIGVEASVLCAMIGLAALSVRCGPITPVLQYASGRGVFLALAVELALLGAAVGGGWWLLEQMAKAAAQGFPRLAVPTEVTDATTGQKFGALGVGVGVTAACELILVQLPAGKQAMCGVVIASYLGAWAAYSYLPLAEGAWYWSAPTVVGLVGYLFAFFGNDGGATGELHGWLAALARPTPLDYASVGTAAALLGHWSNRRLAGSDAPPVLADPDAPPA